MLQHVTDPASCIKCSACQMCCPRQAIEAILERYCIDAQLCGNCRRCIEECPTGAADCFIEVSEPYSAQQQSGWRELPLPAPDL